MFRNSIDITVEWGDCDPAGIVFYPNYFRWFNQGAHALFGAAGMPFHEMIGERGIAGVPMPSHNVYRDRLLGAVSHGDGERDQAVLGLEQARASGLDK